MDQMSEMTKRPGVWDTTCTFCNAEYDDRRPPKLVPGTTTVYGHQACINASTIGMQAVSVDRVAQPEPDSIEAKLMEAQDHLESLLTIITAGETERAFHALTASTSVNEALAELRHSLALVGGA